MKKLSYLVVLISALNSGLMAQTTDEISVMAMMSIQQRKWNEGDIKGYMEYYWKNDSLRFIGSKGITYGWQNTLDKYIIGFPNKIAMGSLTFKIVECTQLSPTAIYVIGKWDLNKEKPSGGHFTLLWKKIAGSWAIVSDHTS